MVRQMGQMRQVRWARRIALLLLMSAIAAIVASVLILGAHLTQWLLTGRFTHWTVGDLVGSDADWLAVPVCLIAPLVGFVSLPLFFATSTFALSRAARPLPGR